MTKIGLHVGSVKDPVAAEHVAPILGQQAPSSARKPSPKPKNEFSPAKGGGSKDHKGFPKEKGKTEARGKPKGQFKGSATGNGLEQTMFSGQNTQKSKMAAALKRDAQFAGSEPLNGRRAKIGRAFRPATWHSR